jgi:Cu-Zn family superoxide dismutase
MVKFSGIALMIHGAENSDNAMERVACGVIGTG